MRHWLLLLLILAVSGEASEQESGADAERLRDLRREAELSPSAVSLRNLARELSSTDRRADTLEAAQLLDRAFSMSDHEWWHVARDAHFLYREAGEPRLAAALRERARHHLPVRPLQRLGADVTTDDVHDVFEQLCSHHVVPVVGPQYCLDSIGAVVSHLATASRSDRDQDIADAVASTMVSIAFALEREAPGWRDQYRAWIDSLVGSGLDSVAVKRLQAHLEEDTWIIVVE